MSTLAELLDRGRAPPAVEEGTHTGTLHKLVRASQKPNALRRRSDGAEGQPPVSRRGSRYDEVQKGRGCDLQQ